MIRAVLFDMDGVLIDACQIHRSAFDDALETVMGPDWFDEHFMHFDENLLEGRPTRVKLELLGITDPLQVRSIFEEKQRLTLAAAKAYPFDRKRVDMLQTLTDRGLYCACVTNSIRATTEEFLKSAGLYPFFDVVVTNEDVEKPKPDPAPYNYAAGRLGLHPSECLVVEDSEVGLESARASGALVLKTTFETLDLR